MRDGRSTKHAAPQGKRRRSSKKQSLRAERKDCFSMEARRVLAASKNPGVPGAYMRRRPTSFS